VRRLREVEVNVGEFGKVECLNGMMKLYYSAYREGDHDILLHFKYTETQ
jgi:hypothetical protein